MGRGVGEGSAEDNTAPADGRRIEIDVPYEDAVDVDRGATGIGADTRNKGDIPTGECERRPDSGTRGPAECAA